MGFSFRALHGDMDTIDEMALIRNVDSPAVLAQKFIEEARRLFEFLSEINEYIGTSTGANPVPPIALSLLLVAMKAGTPEVFGKVCDTFAERAVPNFDTIRSRDVARFCDMAPDLFPEVPRGTLEQVVGILRNDDPDFAETKDDVFAYVDSLLEISIRRQIALGAKSRVPRAAIVDIAAKIKSLPAPYAELLARSG